jgi:DNA repair exonuclease SbcCD ATPase subunit
MVFTIVIGIDGIMLFKRLCKVFIYGIRYIRYTNIKVRFFMRLWSRKEVCEDLNITMKTLVKKIKELNIECVNEVLQNNVVSMKIKHEDYLMIAKLYATKHQIDFKTENNSNDMVLHGLKTELFKTQINLDNALKTLEEKNDALKKAEEKNERLFNEFMELNGKYIDAVSKKGFFSRLFGK